MATFSLLKLSGSTNGLGVKVTGTASGAGVTVHTAVTGTTAIDLITLYAENSDTVTRTLTIGWGGTTSPDNLLVVPIPPQVGPVLVCYRLPLDNALLVTAWADTANVVMVYGSVLRDA